MFARTSTWPGWAPASTLSLCGPMPRATSGSRESIRRPYRCALPVPRSDTPRLFGTDGVRGTAGQYPLDRGTVRRLGAALVRSVAARHRGVGDVDRPLKI